MPPKNTRRMLTFGSSVRNGVYVGTSNGQVYGSADGGDHWQRLPGTLPPILSVTCAVF